MPEYTANPKKNLEIEVSGKTYVRHAIKTHFIQVNESYIEVIKKYTKDIYREGDILSIAEKIIAICQDRVVHKKDIKLSFMARFLSKFVNVTPAGPSVGNPYKMQVAINMCGRFKVLYAAIAAGFGKLFRKKGIFYKIVGEEVSGLDGFYGGAFENYLEMGILIPLDPDGVCKEIKEKLGISCCIVDANDLSVEILGKSDDITLGDAVIAEILKDNPAGQENQQTPMILIHQK